MAEPEGGAPPAAPPGKGGPNAPAKQARREKLIVGGTIVLVLLTYLLLRRASANANNPSSSSSSVPAGIDPTTGLPYATEYAGSPAMGYGSPSTANFLNPSDPTLAALEGQLSAIQSSVASIPQTQPAAGPSPTPVTGVQPWPVVSASPGGPIATGTPSPTVGPLSGVGALGAPPVSPNGTPAPTIGSSGQPIGTYEWTSPGGPGMDPAGTHELTGYAPPAGVQYTGGTYAAPAGGAPPLTGATATAYQTDPAVRNYLNALAAANKGH